MEREEVLSSHLRRSSESEWRLPFGICHTSATSSTQTHGHNTRIQRSDVLRAAALPPRRLRWMSHSVVEAKGRPRKLGYFGPSLSLLLSPFVPGNWGTFCTNRWTHTQNVPGARGKCSGIQDHSASPATASILDEAAAISVSRTPGKSLSFTWPSSFSWFIWRISPLHLHSSNLSLFYSPYQLTLCSRTLEDFGSFRLRNKSPETPADVEAACFSPSVINSSIIQVTIGICVQLRLKGERFEWFIGHLCGQDAVCALGLF